MKINAFEMLRGAIVNNIVDNKIVSNREVTNSRELEKILSILSKTKYGFDLNYIAKLCKFNFVNKKAKEIIFDNGLIYVDSVIVFIDNMGNRKELQQIFVTKSYDMKPIFNLIKEESRLSLQQILCSDSKCGGIFPSSDKNILKKEITFERDDYYTFHSNSYTNLLNDELIIEKYLGKFYNADKNVNDERLLKVLKQSYKNFDFIYSKNELFYVQAKDVGRVDSNESFKIVIEEIDDLVLWINEKLDKTSKKYKSKKYIPM